MLLVVGLGNPGRKYEAHRHNVGFMAVDELASRLRADAFREKFSAHWTKTEIEGQPAVLLKPLTFMNESGRSVQPAAAFFKATPAEIVVVHDELDLPFGEVRLKFGGGHAGHNGLRSIMGALGTGDFGRVRLGVGRPPAGFQGDVADFVLSSFGKEEQGGLVDCLNRAAESVLEVAARGFQGAMNVRNTRQTQQKKEKGPKDVASPDAGAGKPRGSV